MWMVKVRILPPQPIFLTCASCENDRSALGGRQAGFSPTPPAAVHGFHVGVAHLLQIFCYERGTKASAAIQNQLRAGIRNALLDVALDDAAAQVYRIGEMPFIPFIIFA